MIQGFQTELNTTTVESAVLNMPLVIVPDIISL
jgi:hypothetical protein